MSRIRAKDTRPEMHLRRMVHAMGFRFRLHRRDLPGSPDLVFPGKRKVIFVHGCFWHGHTCREGLRRPRSNEAYWLPKIRRTQFRDQENTRSLEKAGWRVLVVWECEMVRPDLVGKIRAFLEP